MQHIVVGVDGSEWSQRALEWAVTEAAAHGAVLTVVTAYDVGDLEVAPGDVPPSAIELRQAAEAVAEGAIAALGRLPEGLVIKRETRAVTAHRFAEALLQSSKGADLLVVGSRGLGGFTGLLVGSVSHQCVGHAACPVLVVRPRGERGTAAA